MIGLDQRATVLAAHPTTGAYTTVVKSGLRCRLAHVMQNPGTTAAERAELAALRNLMWEAGYELPETAQVQIDSITWQPVAGTFGALRGPNGRVLYRRCDAVRVANG